jgi:hypothetical protein
MLGAMTNANVPKHLSPDWTDDTRPPLPTVGGEREMLTAYLDWHRQTVELKCSGVPMDRLAEMTVPPSTLNLHGLVRHLAGVERWWFRIQFAGEAVPLLYYSDDDPGQDFEFAGADFAADLAVWKAECERSREIVASMPSLDQTGTVKRTGQPISLRALLLKLIAEYARHSGHADLLRERIDGVVGQ